MLVLLTSLLLACSSGDRNSTSSGGGLKCSIPEYSSTAPSFSDSPYFDDIAFMFEIIAKGGKGGYQYRIDVFDNEDLVYHTDFSDSNQVSGTITKATGPLYVTAIVQDSAGNIATNRVYLIEKSILDMYVWTEPALEEPIESETFIIDNNQLSSYNGDSNSDTIVTVPSGVTAIGSYAFSGNQAIEKVIIPSSVTIIEQGAFSDCSALTEIIIPDSVMSIDEAAFRNCSNLVTVSLPNTLLSIAQELFSGCVSLKSVVIPNTVMEIAQLAFANCSELASIRLPDSLSTIGERAFSDCPSLNEIEIPESVTSIGAGAFSNSYIKKAISYIEHPKVVEYIFDWNCTILYVPDASLAAYQNTDGWRDALTILPISRIQESSDFIIENNVLIGYIGNERTPVIPEGVETVGEYAFANSQIESVIIPSSTEKISAYAFENSTIVNIIIPDSVVQIDLGAFSYCKSLESITIGAGVNSFYLLFMDCDDLYSITLTNPDPPLVGKRSFGTTMMTELGLSTYPKIYVPASSVANYQEDEFWSRYKDNILPIE